MEEENLEWLNREKQTHAGLVIGIAQFQLVPLHTFLDGIGLFEPEGSMNRLIYLRESEPGTCETTCDILVPQLSKSGTFAPVANGSH